MTDTTYPYDERLPFVLVNRQTAEMMGRAVRKATAENFAAGLIVDVIDTTPAPRVPEDALWIAYSQYGTSKTESWELTLASRQEDLWFPAGSELAVPLEDLPGVTPDTVFTVLDAREERKG